MVPKTIIRKSGPVIRLEYIDGDPVDIEVKGISCVIVEGDQVEVCFGDDCVRYECGSMEMSYIVIDLIRRAMDHKTLVLIVL
jgi:hypothetical protein